MSKAQDRKNIVRVIAGAADAYRKNLVGRRFLYVFDGRYIEVIYKKQNFKHLTGVGTNLSAQQFYQMAAKHMLAASQIWFDSQHPYDLCVRKVKHITQIANLAASESVLLEEITTDSKVYKFGITDLHFSLCMDREYDEQHNLKGDCFVPVSLRDEDCFSKSKQVFVVTHILSRPNDKKQYSELLFMDGGASLSNLPDCVKTMLAENLTAQLRQEMEHANRAAVLT